MHWKKSVLVIQQFLSLFVNRLTVDDKHYLFNRDNLAQPIHMGLPEKRKTFSQFFFFAFLKSILNFKHLQKKDEPHNWCLSQSTGSEKLG